MKIKHITAKQAGEILGISPGGVYKLIERKRLGAVKIGHRLWIRLDAVEAMARSREPQETTVLERAKWGRPTTAREELDRLASWRYDEEAEAREAFESVHGFIIE